MRLPRDPLYRLLVVNAAAGMALAVAFVVALFWFNVAGLGALLLKDHQPALVGAFTAFGFIVTFSSLMMGSAIMMQGGKDEGDGGRRAPEPLTPALASARKQR